MAIDDDVAAVLAEYDRERRELTVPGFRRESTGSVVCHFPLSGTDGFVSYSHHREEEIDVAIPQVVAVFARAGFFFEWKVYEHDSPSSLRDRLAAAGFQVGQAEALMVLPVARTASSMEASPTHRVERVRDETRLADYATVADEVWNRPDWTRQILAELRESPEEAAAYVAYEGDMPVASARATFPKGGRFAGCWSGATRTKYRGRGYYKALVAARAHDAAARGFAYLTVDAAPTSRPILERLGFCRCSTTWPCRWSPDEGNAVPHLRV